MYCVFPLRCTLFSHISTSSHIYNFEQLYIFCPRNAITNFYLTGEQVSAFQTSVHINNAVVNTLPVSFLCISGSFLRIFRFYTCTEPYVLI